MSSKSGESVKPPSTPRIISTILLAFLEITLFSGISYGVTAITQVLESRQVYAHLCNEAATQPSSIQSSHISPFIQQRLAFVEQKFDNSTPKCDALQQQVTLAFTLGQGLNPLGSLASGFLLDKAGYRVMKAVAAAVFAAGCLCLTFVQPGVDWLIFPALLLTGVSGVQILISDLKLAPMVRWFPFVIASMVSGFFDSSTSVFSTLTLLTSLGLDSYLVFGVYTALGVLCILCTIPMYPGEYNAIAEEQLEQQQQEEIEMQQQEKPQQQQQQQEQQQQPQENQSLWRVMLTLEYLLTTIWTICNQLRLNFFIGSHNSYVATIDNDVDVVNSYATIFNYFFFLGPVLAVLPGFITDWQKKCLPVLRDVNPRTLRLNLVTTLAITPIVGLISCGLMYFKTTSVLIPIYIIIAANRVFLYGTFGNFLIAAFPLNLFGQLYTSIILISALFQFLTVPLTNWLVASGGPNEVNLLIMSLLIISFVHPIVLLIRNRKTSSVTANEQ